jgi:hypothetical protein
MQMQKLRGSNMQGFECKRCKCTSKNSIKNLKIQTCNEWNQIWDNYWFTFQQGFNVLSLSNETFSSVNSKFDWWRIWFTFDGNFLTHCSFWLLMKFLPRSGC